MKFKQRLAVSLFLLGLTAQAYAENLNIGVILSLTGPVASMGIPANKTISLWPKKIAGYDVHYTVLDDGSDPTKATLAARKLTTEYAADVLVGPNITPTSLAAMQVAAETKTAMLSLAGGGALVLPQDGPRRWVFKMPPSESIQLTLIFNNMKKNGQKKLGLVAQNNAYGQTFVDVINKMAAGAGIDVVATERFGGSDTSFVSQGLKLLAAKPEAVLIVASGTPSTLPQLELYKRGYAGTIYQTQAVADNDFLRIGGKAVEGTVIPVSPVLVAAQLPQNNVVKPVAMRYVKAYQSSYGNETPSLFGGTAWDVFLMLESAVPVALEKAKPGTPEFRVALRDAIERGKELVLTQGVYTMTPQDHNGADERSQVLIKVENGAWRYME
jgi:branched-chain amino acid transport system substrate-binding protein